MSILGEKNVLLMIYIWGGKENVEKEKKQKKEKREKKKNQTKIGRLLIVFTDGGLWVDDRYLAINIPAPGFQASPPTCCDGRMVVDGGWWWMVVDGGWVPKRFSDFAQNLFRWSLGDINVRKFGKSVKNFFYREKNPTSIFKKWGYFCRKKRFSDFSQIFVRWSLGDINVPPCRFFVTSCL